MAYLLLSILSKEILLRDGGGEVSVVELAGGAFRFSEGCPEDAHLRVLAGGPWFFGGRPCGGDNMLTSSKECALSACGLSSRTS